MPKFAGLLSNKSKINTSTKRSHLQKEALSFDTLAAVRLKKNLARYEQNPILSRRPLQNVELYKTEALKVFHRSRYLDRVTVFLACLKKIDHARQLELTMNYCHPERLSTLMFQLERMFQVEHFTAKPTRVEIILTGLARLMPKKLRISLGFTLNLTLGVVLCKMEALLETILIDEPEVCDRAHELIEEMYVSAFSRANVLRIDLGYGAMNLTKVLLAPWMWVILRLIPEISYFLNRQNVMNLVQNFDFGVLKPSAVSKIWTSNGYAVNTISSHEDHQHVKSA